MIPDIETVKLEIKKINPQPGDIICIKMPEYCFEGVDDNIIKQLGDELKETFTGFPVVFMSYETDLTTMNKDELKSLGLQKIEAVTASLAED